MEERGQYITLLCLQHQKGHLSEKMIRLCLGNAAADVMAKFRQDSAGLWYNERLELEIEKRAAHGEKQRQRAVEGWKKRKNQTFEENNTSHGIQSGNAAALPLGNANANGNEIENKLKGAFDEIYLEQQKMKWMHIDFDFEYRAFCEKVRGSPDRYRTHDTGGIRLAFQSQLRNAKSKKNGVTKKQQHTDSLITGLAERVMQRNKESGDANSK